MRYFFGIIAAVFLLVGVAQAEETGFGDWGTASYDEVMDSRAISCSYSYSPAPVMKADSYHGYSCSGGSYSYDYSYSYDSGPIEYGDESWDWYTI